MLVSLNVNGQSYETESDPRALLLHFLREELGLRGTKYGCGEGECGACSVILNGQTVNACLTTVGQAHGTEILTIEGMAQDMIGAQVIEAFAEMGAVQCGFCTPGFVISARSLLEQPDMTPDIEEIRRGLSGNLCRCTGYTKIIDAVAQAAERIKPVIAPSTSSNGLPATSGAQFARPLTLDESLKLLAQDDVKWHIIAGGTDLLVQYEHRVQTLNLLDISRLTELRSIEETDEAVRIGALATYTDIIHTPALQQQWASALVAASREVGGVQIQNMGTLGGNVVNASPAADGVPPLYVLDASLVLQSTRGQRTVPIQDFAAGPGASIIEADELLTEIIIPKQHHDGQEIAFFEKVGPRKAQTIAKGSVAFRGWLNNHQLTHVRVALGAVAPTVMLAPETASMLMDGPLEEDRLFEAGQVVHNECSPIDDVRSTAVYRRRLVRGILIRNLWPYLKTK